MTQHPPQAPGAHRGDPQTAPLGFATGRGRGRDGDPLLLRPAEVLALQRSAGNGALGPMLARAVRIDGGEAYGRLMATIGPL